MIIMHLSCVRYHWHPKCFGERINFTCRRNTSDTICIILNDIDRSLIKKRLETTQRKFVFSSRDYAL